MADQSSPGTTLEELERLLENDENYCRMLATQQNQAASSSASSTTTTPGPLDTAFLNETNADDQHGQISLSAAQCQTIMDASSTVYRMIDTVVERQPGVIRLNSIEPPTMVSTGTMPMTPVKMISFGTMPITPTQPTRQATTTTSLSLADREIIDLCTPTLPIVDTAASPSIEIIDLCTPNTPTI